MKEIELSTMITGNALNLAGFEERIHVRTRHRQFDWATGWNNILQISLYQNGPDVSEVGSTWLDNIKGMRALRPLNIAEVNALGGEEAFVPNAWTADIVAPLDTRMGEQRGVTSIPWTIDTRIFYYRRDLFARAGISEAEAFTTPEAVYDTLSRLQAGGIRYPLGLVTGGLAVHHLASWVWGRGGRFRSPDFHKIDLVEPEARRGMLDFFRLHRFIDPETVGMKQDQTDQLFFQGRLAVMMNGQWAMHSIKERRPGIVPAVLENTGYAPPPGVPFVGSTHLLIWRHTLYDNEAMHLIAYLTSPPVLDNIFRTTSTFPARLSALNAAPFINDRDYQMVIDCLHCGRTFRSARLWAGIESRLNLFCYQLWEDLFANPTLDLEMEIEHRVQDLANRLEKTLLASW